MRKGERERERVGGGGKERETHTRMEREGYARLVVISELLLITEFSIH